MKAWHGIQFVLLFTAAAHIHAQTLNQPNPVGRLSDVIQFGVPRDTKYILCDGDDCPDRSIKHIDAPAPPAASHPTPISMQLAPPAPAVELSRAKVEEAKEPAKPVNSVKHARHHKKNLAPKVACKPA